MYDIIAFFYPYPIQGNRRIWRSPNKLPDAGLARHSLDGDDCEMDGPRLEAHLGDLGGERGRSQVATGCHVRDPGVLLIQADLRSNEMDGLKMSEKNPFQFSLFNNNFKKTNKKLNQDVSTVTRVQFRFGSHQLSDERYIYLI